MDGFSRIVAGYFRSVIKRIRVLSSLPLSCRQGVDSCEILANQALIRGLGVAQPLHETTGWAFGHSVFSTGFVASGLKTSDSSMLCMHADC